MAKKKKKNKHKNKHKNSVKSRVNSHNNLKNYKNVKEKKIVKGELELPKEKEIDVTNNKQIVEQKLKEINKKIKSIDTSSDELYDLILEKKKTQKELNQIKKLEKEAKEKEKKEDSFVELPSGEELELPKLKKEVIEQEEVSEEVSEETQEIQDEVDIKENTSDEIITEDKDLVLDNKKFNNVLILMFVLSLVLGLLVGICLYFVKNKTVKVESNSKNEIVDVADSVIVTEDDRLDEYTKCLDRPLDDKDRTDEIINTENDLRNYLSKYKVSLGYKDYDTGYEFYYNEKPVYYAASSTKILVVLYLYTEAAKGNIDLETTIKYNSIDKWSASPEMGKVRIGSNVSLRMLSKYTLTVSDNTAYQMLVKYVGRNKIKQFGKDLGAKYTFVGGDNFGSITVNDGLIYWDYVYKFINENGELGKELKNYMISAEQNGLSLDKYGIQAAHKYGEYSPNYHDLGIVFSKHPYRVVILTKEYGKNMVSKIQDINNKIYELHLKYYENRKNICNNEIYGN